MHWFVSFFINIISSIITITTTSLQQTSGRMQLKSSEAAGLIAASKVETRCLHHTYILFIHMHTSIIAHPHKPS